MNIEENEPLKVLIKIPVIAWTTTRSGITRPIMEFIDYIPESVAHERFKLWLKYENRADSNR